MTIVSLDDALGAPKQSALWKVRVDEYTYVLYATSFVEVYKGDSDTSLYEITPNGCTCNAYRYKGVCKHSKTVEYLRD